MLSFVGLGLYDERSITIHGRDTLRSADRAFIETYTSRLTGTTIDGLESFHDVPITVVDRHTVEQTPSRILDPAETEHVVFLTGGDPMISTTHVDLRLRAHDRTIATRIVHGTTAQTAASSLTGLQNYRFGKATTLPFPGSHGGHAVPQSVLATLELNRENDLHTLVYLDIDGERSAFLSATTAAATLATHYEDTLGVVIARAGSPDPVVVADRLSVLGDRDYGPPLHLLVIPSTLHHIESDALRKLADAPPDRL